MRLIDDWKRVLRRGLSVRFNLFNAFCQGVLWGTTGFTMGWSVEMTVGFVVLCVGLSLAPIGARILWQRDLHGDEPEG
jgi:hypothetical protein